MHTQTHAGPLVKSTVEKFNKTSQGIQLFMRVINAIRMQKGTDISTIYLACQTFIQIFLFQNAILRTTGAVTAAHWP